MFDKKLNTLVCEPKIEWKKSIQFDLMLVFIDQIRKSVPFDVKIYIIIRWHNKYQLINANNLENRHIHYSRNAHIHAPSLTLNIKLIGKREEKQITRKKSWMTKMSGENMEYEMRTWQKEILWSLTKKK